MRLSIQDSAHAGLGSTNNLLEQVALATHGAVVKNLPANAGDAKDTGSIPGSERFPGVGNSNPLQYTCLGNSMDREV